MAFDFPASPTTGQVFTVGNATYTYNGYAWMGGAQLVAPSIVSDTPPANPLQGQLWWESDSGMLFTNYNDGNTTQWVQINALQANAVLKPWGINHAEYNLLMMVYGTEEQALTPSQIGDAAGEKLANVTRLTDGLCAKGLLRRKPSEEDRRKIVLSLSAKGVAAVEGFLPAISDLLNRQLGTLDGGEQRQLEKLLKKMLAGLDG